jgi:pimeloyl-ACP methyl ester carboxylesterase
MQNYRTYGKPPFTIAVIHGGPGAPGEMAPVARELSSAYTVLEPLQTKPTVAGQIEELKSVLENRTELPVILVGHSWGAMLGYMFTGENPDMVKKLILVSSGSYEDSYAAGIMDTRFSRMSPEQILEMDAVLDKLDDPAEKQKDALLARFGEIMSAVDSYNPIPHRTEAIECNYEINKSISAEAGLLRSSGRLLSCGRNINCPVVAIHGSYDTHPAEGIRAPLSGVVKDFRFILLEKCGHDPWYEREARDEFYRVLYRELATGQGLDQAVKPQH